MALLYIFKQLNQKRKKSIDVTFPVEEKPPILKLETLKRKSKNTEKALSRKLCHPALKSFKLLKRSKISHKNVTCLQMAVLLNLSSSFHFVQLFCTTTMLLAVLSRFQVILRGSSFSKSSFSRSGKRRPWSNFWVIENRLVSYTPPCLEVCY